MLRIRPVYFFLFACTIASNLRSQTFEVIDLSSSINETSGLEFFRDSFITHNDSGNTSSLFCLNSDGKIVFQRDYPEILNIDWEDLAADSNFLYIADTGNNYDTRTDLRILKFDLKTLDYVGAINFKYSIQKSFLSNPKSEFDAEAIINLDSNLVLFSKNRKYRNSQLYLIPKELGNYSLKKFGDLDSELIITGGDFSPELELLVLTGTKDFKEYYIQRYEGFSFGSLNYRKKETILIPFDSLQVEAVKIIDSFELIMTSESEDVSKRPKLIKVTF